MEYKALLSAVPHRNLETMLGRLRLGERDLALLDSHRELFIGRREEFAAFFYGCFFEIPETRILLERYDGEVIRRIWAAWYERLFREDMGPGFIGYLWRIGVRHVEVSLDQRFSNLGFSLVRQFSHRVATEGLPVADALGVLGVVDKLVDSCILVETSAYIEATVRCDVEILRGIADKIRNPVTIIGGNLKRLRRRATAGDRFYEDLGFLISYISRCEDLIADIGTYIEVFQREARLETCMLETVIENTIETLASKDKLHGARVEPDFGAVSPMVIGDPVDLRHLFYHIIENAAEAAAKAGDPLVRISFTDIESPQHSMRVEVFNSGEVINLNNLENIMSPFYSTKSEGSGLGLSIAKLVLRKSFGDMAFEPIQGQGTKIHITLQRAK